MIDVIDKERQVLDTALAAVVDDAAVPERDYLHCAVCSAVISRQANAIEVNGSHLHHCTNPHGFEFAVRCFSEALGCTIGGDRQHADSWFPGFCWRYASCSDCHQHLGWYFDRGDDYFYGLILDRIQS